MHSLIASMLAIAILISIPLTHLYRSLPNISNPETWLASQSIVITDRNHQELYRFYQEEDRTSLSSGDVPQHTVDAFIAIEDKRFWNRKSCIDLRALVRATFANIGNFKSQGASTITQQLVRTAFLNREKTVSRKMREIMLACKLELLLTKEEIFSMYVNWISFGHGIGGIQQAAKRYFGVDAKDLSIAQSAVLASLPQRPTYLSPYGPHVYTTLSQDALERIRNGNVRSIDQLDTDTISIGLLPTQVRIGDSVTELPGRSSVVLQAMVNQDHITQEQWNDAKVQLRTINILERKDPILAPHFVLGIREIIENRIRDEADLHITDGITVQTTLDASLQKQFERILQRQYERLSENYNAHNIAAMAVDPLSGEIRAYAGNTNFFDDEHVGQMDMARRPRQTGSAFKPFIYGLLMEQGYTPESYIYDTPLHSSIYKPFSKGFYGRMTMRTALGRSRNTPAVRAFYAAGGEDVILDFAEMIGITSPKVRKEFAKKSNPRFKYAWSLALGAGEASLLEMVGGYSMLALDGMHQSLIGIRSIRNRNGGILYAPKQTRRRVLSESSAQAITDILRDEEAREESWKYAMHLPGTALKTGTGNICKNRDTEGACTEILANNTWAIGYTDDLVVGVWVGNADNTPLIEEASALEVAVPVWKELMKVAMTMR